MSKAAKGENNPRWLGGIWFKDGVKQYSDFTRHKRKTNE